MHVKAKKSVKKNLTEVAFAQRIIILFVDVIKSLMEMPAWQNVQASTNTLLENANNIIVDIEFK